MLRLSAVFALVLHIDFCSVTHPVRSCLTLLLLFSYCSVFWDLYCAAPDRRETCEHSSEAKAFHDYVSDSSFSQSFTLLVKVGAERVGPVWPSVQSVL